MNRIACLLILSCACLCIQAQSGYILKGTVCDTLNAPIPNAIISLLSGDALVGTSLTNKEGYYEFEKIQAGKYTIDIASEDYMPFIESIKIDEDKQLRHMLKPIKHFNLAGLTVTADRSNVITANAQSIVFHLSQRAKRKNNVYEALTEIPLLQVDPYFRKIGSPDGNKVILLINGIQRESSMETVDPADIEAVEIMDNPPAKYLKDGFAYIVNIKLKRKMRPFQVFNINFSQDVELFLGAGGGGYEFGNDKFSLRLGTFVHYYNNEPHHDFGTVQSGNLNKVYDKNKNLDYRHYEFWFGGDYIPAKRHYLTFHGSFFRDKEMNDGEGNGSLQSGNALPIDYKVHNTLQSTPKVGVGRVFYRYTLNEDTRLENELGYSYNASQTDENNLEEGMDYYYQQSVHNKLINHRGNHILDFIKNLSETSSLTIGLNSSFTSSSIDNFSSINTTFHYRSWNEYLYAGYNGQWKRLSYGASAGADLFFNKVENNKDRYARLKFSVSGNYKFNPNHSLNVYARGFTSMPGLSLLNPYNTSTDSLLVLKGNPLLKPSYIWTTGLNYRLAKGQWYFQPYLSYTHQHDMYDRIGSTHNNVYTITYENKGKEEQFSSGFTLRYNLKNIGYLGLNGNYQHHYFETRHKGWFSGQFNWTLYYKSFTWSGFITMSPNPYTYQEFSKSKLYNNSYTAFFWQINKNWRIDANVRYLIQKCKSERWTDDPSQGYHAYVKRTFPERNFQVMIGVQYTWKNNVKRRNVKQLQLDKSSIQLLRE